MNPTLHHPSWYHLIGQLSKEELAVIVAGKALSVTPVSSNFSAPLFSIACNKTQWCVNTRHKDAHERILQMTVKSFDDLLPETPIEQYTFTFTFSLDFNYNKIVDFLMPRIQNFIKLDAEADIAITLVNTSTAEAVRQRKVRLYSASSCETVLLTCRFTYPTPDQRMFSLRQQSIVENYELDYDEALTTAEQLAVTLMESEPGSANKNLSTSPSSN